MYLAQGEDQNPMRPPELLSGAKTIVSWRRPAEMFAHDEQSETFNPEVAKVATSAVEFTPTLDVVPAQADPYAAASLLHTMADGFQDNKGL